MTIVALASGHALGQGSSPATRSTPIAAEQRYAGQSATLLPNGEWLLVGGEHDGRISRAATLIDPRANRTFVLPAQLSTARSGHTATVLADGGVLVLGGTGADGHVVAGIERLDTAYRAFMPVQLDIVPRTEHTATLLTDGRVLVVGGLGRDGHPVADVELVDLASGKVERFDARMETVRFGHLAALLPSAPVLVWGGLDASLKPATQPELFLPDGRTFARVDRSTQAYLPDPSADIAVPAVTGVHPAADAVLALNETLTVRFSTALAGETVNADSVTLIGPNGVIPIRVVSAEGGLLTFVKPAQDLNPRSTYTLFIRGARSAAGIELPLTALTWKTGGVETATRSSERAQATSTVVPFAANADATRRDAAAQAREARRLAGLAAEADQERLSDTTFELTKDDVVCGSAADEAWTPDIAAVKTRGWNSQRGPAAIPKHLAKLAPEGVTAVGGQLLRLNGRPLSGATVRIGEQVAHSDKLGLFLLRDLAPGAHTMTVDGTRAADCNGADFGYYEIRVTAQAGRTTTLDYPIWMARIDQANAVTVAAPTTRDVVITHPQLPGLEVHIPAGTLIRDRAGKIVTRVSITPVPNDRPPYPMPEIAEFPVYFTLQPGGARLEGVDGRPKQAKLVYPNYTDLPTGKRIVFWSYDASDREWHVYGTGGVSATAKTIEPNEGVGLYAFTGFSVAPSPDPPPCTSECCGGGPPPTPGGPPPQPGGDGPGDPLNAGCGDPVDAQSGQFVHSSVEFQIPDVMPLSLRRTYFSQDGRSREFGRGMMADVEQYIYNPVPGVYSELWLVTSGGGRVKFACTTGCSAYATAQYVAQGEPGYYSGAAMRFLSASGWEVTTRDGTVSLYYKLGAKLMSIADRYGNVTSYVRAGGPNGALTRIVSPNGRFIAFTYDAGGRISRAEDHIGRAWTYLYDTSGRMTSATNPMGGQWQYTWNGATSQMLTVRDPRGNVMVTNQYDGNGRVVKQTYADSTTNLFAYTLSGTTVTETAVTDRRGNVRKLEFDAGGRIMRNTFALGLPEQQVTSLTRQAGDSAITSVTDALGRRSDFGYDSQGNLLTVTRLAGTANAVTTRQTYTSTFKQLATVKDPLGLTTTFTYDALGNLTRVTNAMGHQTNMTYNAQGQVDTVRNGLNFTTTYTYDAGLPATSKDPLNRITSIYTDAVGRVVRVKDPAGNATQTRYDALDRIVQTIDPLGNAASFEYDANGNMTAHVDKRGGRTTYAYDAMNRLVSRQDALGRTETFQYDAAGMLLRFTDRKSQVTGFAYDALNRRTRVGFGATVASPTAYTSTVDYSYDAGNRKLQVADSANGTITYGYDGLDRLTSETTDVGVVAYTYDAAGRRTTRSVPGQPQLAYTWDNANRLTALNQGALGVTFAYDNAQRRTSTTLPNGVVATFTHDSANQLTAIAYARGGTPLGDLSYSYDSAGRRTTVGGTLARTSLPTAVASAQVNANDQLTQWGAASLSFDLNGNLVSDGTYTYTWDARNQLVQVAQGAAPIATYAYDPAGRRIRKTVGGVTTRFVFDGGNFVQERDSTGAVTADLLTGLFFDEVFARTKASVSRTFLTDHVGSIVAEADGTGNILTSYTYEPYGKTTQTGAPSDNSQRFTGREEDIPDLYFYRSRYYSPQFDRFASEDPIGVAGGLNLYGYVEGDPISYVDPDGFRTLYRSPQYGWRQPYPNWPGSPGTPGRGNPLPPRPNWPPSDRDPYEELPDSRIPGTCMNWILGCPNPPLPPGCWYQCPPPNSCTPDNPSGKCRIRCTSGPTAGKP